jgi:hypothetical protein
LHWKQFPPILIDLKYDFNEKNFIAIFTPMQEGIELYLECEYLCRSVYGLHPDIKTVQTYLQANHIIFSKRQPSLQERFVIHQCIKRKLDAEAVEFFMRIKRPKNSLSQKVHIISYLLETNPEYYSVYINEKRTPVHAWASLIFYIARSIVKFVKGSLIIMWLNQKLLRKQETADV